MQFLYIASAHVDLSLHEVAVHLHLVQSHIQVFLLHYVQLQVFMPSEELTLSHRLHQTQQEVSQFPLSQSQQVLSLHKPAFQGSVDRDELSLVFWEFVLPLAEVIHQSGQFPIQVALCASRVQHKEDDSILLPRHQTHKEIRERDADHQRVALGDPEDCPLESLLLIQLDHSTLVADLGTRDQSLSHLLCPPADSEELSSEPDISSFQQGDVVAIVLQFGSQDVDPLGEILMVPPGMVDLSNDIIEDTGWMSAALGVLFVPETEGLLIGGIREGLPAFVDSLVSE